MTAVETKTVKNSTAKSLDPCTLIIFGANGDLTKRLLMPALYNLKAAGLLPNNFAIIGTGQKKMSDEVFRSLMTENLKQFATITFNTEIWQWFLERLYFVDSASKDINASNKLKECLITVDKKHKTGGNTLFYMAVPPAAVPSIVDELDKLDLIKQKNSSWHRLAIEKPFGHDRNSAKLLNKTLLQVADESQIFRMDHYLGKESVQNIMVFRFANGIFEPTWNNKYIDNIQITVAETLGVEERGAYYENNGALRDMIQNHLFQMLALTTMDAPARYDADSVRACKEKIFQSIRPYNEESIRSNVIRGQYTAGQIDHKSVAAYRDEPSVKKDSLTETYVALKVLIDNDRWSGVPIYLRTGKRLSKHVTNIAIEFKTDRLTDFGKPAITKLETNTLLLKIQPNEGICLQFAAKVPGEVLDMQMLAMDCEYADYFGKHTTNGYETLLYDCLLGDPMLFASADNVETNWGTVDPILKYWQNGTSDTLHLYKSGSSGPGAANALLERDGKKWRELGE